jgi:hypothetical protein
MQVGIDSFAAWDDAGLQISPSETLQRLVEQIEYADRIGLDVFGAANITEGNFWIQPQPSS